MTIKILKTPKIPKIPKSYPENIPEKNSGILRSGLFRSGKVRGASISIPKNTFASVKKLSVEIVEYPYQNDMQFCDNTFSNGELPNSFVGMPTPVSQPPSWGIHPHSCTAFQSPKIHLQVLKN